MKTPWIIAAVAGAVAVASTAVVVTLLVTRPTETPAAPAAATLATAPRVAETAPPPANFARYQSADVIAAFRAHGVEVGATAPVDPSGGFAPVTEREGTRFLIPSLGRDNGGRVFSFADPQSLAAKRDFYVGLARRSGMAFSWVFTKHNVLVQINGTLPRERAMQYNDALARLR